MAFTEVGIDISFILEQFEKAPFHIRSKPSDKFTSNNPVQSIKAYSSIVVTLSGISIFCNPIHPPNAICPIYSTPSFIVKSFIFASF